MSRTAIGRATGALLVAAAVAAGCGHNPGQGIPFPVTGRVTQSPTANCPINRPEECTPAPVAGARIHATERGGTRTSATTGADGSYVLRLPSGSYTLVVEPATSTYPRCPPVELVVSAAATQDINCDSGIRTAG